MGGFWSSLGSSLWIMGLIIGVLPAFAGLALRRIPRLLDSGKLGSDSNFAQPLKFLYKLISLSPGGIISD